MKFAERLKCIATGTSAATITLSGAVTGFRTLAQAIADGALAVGDTGVPFTIDDGAGNKETSLFTITSATVLTRTSVLSSSAGGTTAATFTGTTLIVFSSMPADFASKLLIVEADGPAPLIVMASTPPNNADGRPNFTMHFQTVLSNGVVALSIKIGGVYQPVGNGSASYTRMRAALAAVSANTGYAKIGLLGDSTMAGAKAGTSGVAARATTPVTFLRDQLLATQSRPAIASNWIGDQRFQVTNAIDPYTFDTRFSQPDGSTFIATSGATPVSVAGSLMTNSSNANRFGFLPEVATDTTDVYYAVNTTLGAFSISRNGGSAMAVNQAGASGMGKVTYSSPLNSVDPIYLSRTSGGAYVVGMDSYNSAIKSIRLFGMGWSGGRAADWAATLTGFDPLNGLIALGLDLVVARFGTNDISIPGAATTSTDPAAYRASINKILDALTAAGTNVILATHYPMNTTVTSQAVQDTYAGYVRSIAAARGLKVHDTYARVGTWAAASAAGKVFDNLHPNAAGYRDDAVALAALILTLA